MKNTESLHLNRPEELKPTPNGIRFDGPIQPRTVEHYRLVNALDGDIDPELGQ